MFGMEQGPSRASQRLVAWRTKKGLKQPDLAKTLEIQVSQLSNFETGHKKPGREIAARIQRKTGVKVLDWDEPPDEDAQMKATG